MRNLLLGLMLAVVLSGCGGGGSGVVNNDPKTVGPTVTVVSSGAGKYTIQGEHMDGVGGIDMTVTYDSASLSSPSLTLGNLVPGALFAANTNQPNTIKIGVVSAKAFAGSGPIAQITFATHQANAPTPTIATYSLIRASGGTVGGPASTDQITAPSSPGNPFGTFSSAQSVPANAKKRKL